MQKLECKNFYVNYRTLRQHSKLNISFKKAFAKNAILNAHKRLDFNPQIHHSVLLQKLDFDTSMEHIRSIMSDAIGAPKIPKVKFQDIGGLQLQKQEILNLLMPLLNPDLQQSGLSRSGILMYGKKLVRTSNFMKKY